MQNYIPLLAPEGLSPEGLSPGRRRLILAEAPGPAQKSQVILCQREILTLERSGVG